MPPFVPKTALALVVGASLALGAVAPAVAQNRSPLESLAPLIEELAADHGRRLSHHEIEERARARAADEFFAHRRPGPRALYHSYRAYQEEKWALEDYEHARKEYRRRRIMGAFGNFVRDLARQR